MQMTDHATPNGLLHDICDGQYYKDHSFFRAHSNALQVMLYYDDVEMCNPLGSKTKKNKLGRSCLKLHHFTRLNLNNVMIYSHVLLQSC